METKMAVDIFLDLEGIKGESKDGKHAETIDVLSWSWGMSQSGTAHMGSGAGAGKVSVQDINFTHYIDKASPTLMLFCCNGKHIANGMITVRKAGEKPLEYLKIKLTDILISGVQEAGHGGATLSESVTINFAKFHLEYLEQKPDGSGVPGGEMGWDVKSNTKA
jgi:type VI secretion system secreted protein Hcp